MSVEGYLQVVKDAGPSKGKYGTQYRISIKVEEEWYSGFFAKSAESLGLEEGRLVTFDYTEKGDFKNVDTKSLKVSTTVAPATATGGRKINPEYAVGRWVNGAVALVQSGRVDDLKQGILLCAAAEQWATVHFERILADSKGLDITGGKDQPAAEAPSVPASKPKAAATKPKAKATPAPEPIPEPEPEPAFDEPAEEASDAEAEPEFSDDIPF